MTVIIASTLAVITLIAAAKSRQEPKTAPARVKSRKRR